MKKTKKATSILEAIVTIMIVTMWVVWVYNILFESWDLVDSVAHRMKAIEIAREWIEAVTNIRDTNWIVLWADPENCWNTFNYDKTCVLNNWTGSDIKSWSYKVNPS